MIIEERENTKGFAEKTCILKKKISELDYQELRKTTNRAHT